jgi:16S rRNA (uracil1498-N3)-methyltransferase
MALSRFYCDVDLGRDSAIMLPQAIAHHAVKVLRLGVGQEMVLFDGTGGEHVARIERIRGDEVTARVFAFSGREAESPLDIWVGQSLCANEKMDWVLQKAVELGASRFSPLATERSVVRLTPERAARRHQHWQRVAVAACEQSGRNRVPVVDEIQPLRRWLTDLTSDSLKLVLSPSGTATLRDLPKPAASVVALVGPEGGLSADEMDAAQACGFLPLRLGPRILRTETAALALLAAIQTEWGDFFKLASGQPL